MKTEGKKRFEISFSSHVNDQTVNEAKLEFIVLDDHVHQPVISITDVNTGLDISVKMPYGNYTDLLDKLQGLTKNCSPEDAQKMVSKLMILCKVFIPSIG